VSDDQRPTVSKQVSKYEVLAVTPQTPPLLLLLLCMLLMVMTMMMTLTCDVIDDVRRCTRHC